MATEVASLYATVGMDSKGFDAGQKKITGGLGSIGSAFKTLLPAVAIGAAVAGGIKALGDSIGKATEEQVGITSLAGSIENIGESYDGVKDSIEDYLKIEQKRIALDDGKGRGAIQALVEATGDLGTSIDLVSLAADVATAKDMDLVEAAKLVGRVSQGNVGILARYGIQLKKGATATEALGALQTKYGGQAERYARTLEGTSKREQVAIGNIQEVIGSAFIPLLTKAKGKLADFLTDNLPAIETFATNLAGGIDKAITSVGKIWDAFTTTPGDFGTKLQAAILEGANEIGGADLVNKVADIIGVGRALSESLSKGDWAGAWGIVSNQIIAGFNSVWPKIQAAWTGTGGSGLSMEGTEFDFGTVGLKEKLSAWIGDLKAKLTDISPAFAPLITAIESSITRIGDFITSLGDFTGKIDLSGVSVSSFQTTLTGLKDFIETQLGPAFSTLVDVHLANFTTTIEAGNNTVTIMGDVFDTVKGYVEKFSVSIGRADTITKSFGGTLSSAFTSAVGEQIVSVFTMITNPLAWWIKQVGLAQNAWTNFVNALKGGATMTAPTVPSLPVRSRAQGGSDWVTKPTLFLAGERGPERVTVTPQGKAGGGNNITFNITGRNAEEISRTVIRRLREVGL